MQDKNTPVSAGAISEKIPRDIIAQLPDVWRHAIAYAKQKWSVFPCNGKVPLTPQGYKNGSTDLNQILEWSRSYPDANVAIATGDISGFMVVDADDPSAVQTLKEQELVTKTVVSKTGRGYHYFYRIPDGISVASRTGILPKVDIRSNGGYIIAPPSLHPSGRRYEFVVSPKETQISQIPPKLLDLILNGNKTSSSEPAGQSSQVIDELRDISKGGIQEHDGRNQAATRLYGYLLRHYVDPFIATSLIDIWNRTNSPPLADRELQKIVESVSGRELNRRRRQQGRDIS